MVLPEPLPTSRPEYPLSHVPGYTREAFTDGSGPNDTQKTIAGRNRKVAEEFDMDDAGSNSTEHSGHYGYGGRQGCLQGLQEAVLEKISLWSKDVGPLRLTGVAGTGKSTALIDQASDSGVNRWAQSPTSPNPDQKPFGWFSRPLYEIHKARGILPLHVIQPEPIHVGESWWDGCSADVSKGEHRGSTSVIKRSKPQRKDGPDKVSKVSNCARLDT